MMRHRLGYVLFAAVLAASTAAPASGQTVVVPQTPFSLFQRPAATPLDGMVTWVLVRDAPEIGENAVNFYGFTFVFSGAPNKIGFIGLASFPGGRIAYGLFGSGGDLGFEIGNVVPTFNWKVGRAYLLYVHPLPQNTWEVMVYDSVDRTWTTIVPPTVLPAEWGTFGVGAATAMWMAARDYPTCESIPSADVMIYSPIGISGATHTPVPRVFDGFGAGHCPGIITVFSDGWSRYRFPA